MFCTVDTLKFLSFLKIPFSFCVHTCATKRTGYFFVVLCGIHIELDVKEMLRCQRGYQTTYTTFQRNMRLETMVFMSCYLLELNLQ